MKKKIFLLSFLVVLGLFLGFAIILSNSPDNPPGPGSGGVNIRVCVHPPFPDVSDAARPIFS